MTLDSQAERHIVKSFDEDLAKLANAILRMGGMAERQLVSAVEALSKRNGRLAQSVISADHLIDDLEHEVDEFATRVVALRQPMAQDLRLVVSAPKMASEIERVGDYAANIAKRVAVLNQNAPVRPINAIPRLASIVQQMIKDVLDAFADQNLDKANAVRFRDEEVDEMYTSLFRELLTYMMEDPRNITPCTHVLFIAKNLERIGDHATNIAERVYYILEGERPEKTRPKSDETPFTSEEDLGES